jgi:hypothetical protein
MILNDNMIFEIKWKKAGIQIGPIRATRFWVYLHLQNTQAGAGPEKNASRATSMWNGPVSATVTEPTFGRRTQILTARPSTWRYSAVDHRAVLSRSYQSTTQRLPAMPSASFL